MTQWRANPGAISQQAFQPFDQAEGSKSQGLGLGLYISSDIARAHGGTLAVLFDEKMHRFTFSMSIETTHPERLRPKRMA